MEIEKQLKLLKKQLECSQNHYMNLQQEIREGGILDTDWLREEIKQIRNEIKLLEKENNG